MYMYIPVNSYTNYLLLAPFIYTVYPGIEVVFISIVNMNLFIFLLVFRLHYMASTNAGFCQGNMTWCYKVCSL